jgi:diguanylate cyclase (GGDEF)-like protein
MVLTAVAIIAVQRMYQMQKAGVTADQRSGKKRSTYRDEAFAEIIKINEDTASQGVIDSLTGLPGRQVFDERLRKVQAYSRQYNQIFSVMVLNLDEFNNINQVYGSVFGNKLIAETANRVRTVLRQIDTVSRYAGDNFCFILPELSNPEVAVLVAQRIQDSIIQPFIIDGTKLFVTACIGIAISDAKSVNALEFINKAQDALMKAKLSGRNTYRIYNQVELISNDREAKLRTCFDDSDFIENLVMYYQPYVDVARRNSLCSVQAIPYFNHPEIGFIPFQEFSRAVEAGGRVVEMGEWQIKQSIKQLQHWQVAGFNPEHMMISVTINQLQHPDFITRISEILGNSGVDKNQVIFDIIESNIKENSQSFKNTLEKIQALGIKVSMSVLALGRMALHNIFEFPINYLKIDEKLVKGLMMNMDNDAIIVSLIALSNNTNIKVIADAVDVETQKNKLIELGCTLMKGKLFSPPAPGNEIFDQAMSRAAEDRLTG